MWEVSFYSLKPTAVGVRRIHPPLPRGGGLPSTLGR